MTVLLADVEVGTELPAQWFPVVRADLVRYCGASGDFNVIHWNHRVAVEVGLPDVIAHGMFTMASAARVVTDWVGDPARCSSTACGSPARSWSPTTGVGATIEVSGKVIEVLGDHQVRIELTAVSAGTKVLGVARAVVRLG